MPAPAARPFQLLMVALLILSAGLVVWIGPAKLLGKGDGADGEARNTPWKPLEDHFRRSADGITPVKLSSLDKPQFASREGESLLRFKDEESYRRFLAKADQYGVKILGQLDGLRTLRVAIEDQDAWNKVPESEKGEQSPNFLAYVPGLPEGGIQADAVGFGTNLLPWLGITGDNSAWGKGVTVAILDTGVAAHPGLTSDITSLSLLAVPVDPSLNGHGTGVASLIAGNSEQAPGISPGSKLLAIQIVDETGFSDTFMVAEGILSAIEGGAKVINISLGSPGDSQVLRDAVAYAQKMGVVIVASAGNNGIEGVSYPAAYEGVIAVGSVDARGEKLDFSNTGWSLDATAPGYDLTVAWPGDKLAGFSGTSASAPVIAAGIAATMSQFNLSAPEAAALVLGTMNEAGTMGADQLYGNGILDVGRVMNWNTPGIYDVAVATQSLSVNAGGGTVNVIVQNRGTETLQDTNLTVTAGGEQVTVNTGTLAPGQSILRTVRLGDAESYALTGATVQSRVSPPVGISDANPSNNSRSAAVSKGK